MSENKLEKQKPTIEVTSMIKSLSVYSARGSTGWVLRFNGVDSYDNTFSVGFDATGGVYCYFNDSPLWNIRP